MKIDIHAFQVFGGLMLSFTAKLAAATECSNLMFTEIADPDDSYQARFVELYNDDAGCNKIGKHNGKDIYLATVFNSNTDYSSKVLLTGQTIPSDGFFLVCYNEADFLAAYPTSSCDLASGSVVASNGDDSYLVSSNF